MQTVTVTEAKAQLSSLVQRVLDGDEVAIGRRGRPEVVLRRYRDHDAGVRPLGDYDGPYRYDDDELGAADAEIEELFLGDGR